VPQPGEGRLYLTDEVPARAQCASAFGFVFVDERILLTRLRRRGWDIPGGVIEPGETPEAAAVRETWEETCTQVKVVELLGIQELETFAPKPEPYRWPYPISIQLYYRCRLVEWQPFVVNDESIERGLFAPSEARGLATIQHHAPLYEAGLQRVRGGL
jgi:8-oxo-dGTP pyrophosphatase MutT (NUDIX family)